MLFGKVLMSVAADSPQPGAHHRRRRRDAAWLLDARPRESQPQRITLMLGNRLPGRLPSSLA